MMRTHIRLLLLLTLLLAWGLRLWRLDYQELRGDEVFGYFFSLRPFDDIVQATVDLQEPHPVASYVVQQWWLGWAGHSEFALRFTSVWFGALTVALLWRLAQALALPAKSALLATLLLAVSPYAIWHSQDARMYSMSLALTTASTWFMLTWLQRQRRSWAFAYGLVSWLALHTHYFSVFVLAAQNLFVFTRVFLRLFHRGMNDHASMTGAWGSLVQQLFPVTIINWLILQATLAFFYGPWLLRVQGILTGYHGNGDSPTLAAMAQRAGSVFLVGESVPVHQRLWWALLAGILLGWSVLALLRGGSKERRALLLLLLYGGIPLLATWWSATQRPIFNERYLVAAAPPFYLLLAAGLSGLASARPFPVVRKINRAVASTRSATGSTSSVTGSASSAAGQFRVQPIIVVGLMLVALVGMGLSLNRHYTDPAYSKTRGWRTLAATLAQWSAGFPADAVRIAQNFPDPTLWYYYRGATPHVVLPPGPQDEVGAQATVQQLHAAGVERVLLPLQPAPHWDDRGIAAAALATTYGLLYEAPVGVWPVQIYGAPSLRLTPIAIQFQNGVGLTGVAIQPATLTPGNVLAIQLAWQGEATALTGTEKVFVQLLNGAGQLVAQDDRPLLRSTAQSTMSSPALYGILLPTTLPAGAYQLISGLYDPARPGAPRVLTTAGVDHVVLGTLNVAVQDKLPSP